MIVADLKREMMEQVNKFFSKLADDDFVCSLEGRYSDKNVFRSVDFGVQELIGLDLSVSFRVVERKKEDVK